MSAYSTKKRYASLILALVYRDITSKYRRSMLGPAWAILQPLLLMAVFTLLSKTIGISSDGLPYVLFSYAVLVPWTFFTTAVNGCCPSIMSNASILKKIALPKELFPISAVVTAVVDMAAASLILAGMMLWYRVPMGWELCWVPVLTALTAALAFGVGIGIASLGIFKRDFLPAGAFLMQLWLYATPIIYPLSSISDRWRPVYILNPMVGILEGFRSVLARGQAPDLLLILLAIPGIALVLLITWPLFRKTSQYFADVL